MSKDFLTSDVLTIIIFQKLRKISADWVRVNTQSLKQQMQHHFLEKSFEKKKKIQIWMMLDEKLLVSEIVSQVWEIDMHVIQTCFDLICKT